MFKAIWYLLRTKSDSQMKGFDMGWEWNWPSFWLSDSLTWFQIDLETSIKGDHSPSFHGLLVVFNCKLLDFGYYNSYHEVESPDDAASVKEWNDALAEAYRIVRERKRQQKTS